jgi:hypothetical protein
MGRMQISFQVSKPRCEPLWTVDVDRSLEKDGPDEPVGPEKRETLIGRNG